MTQLAVGGDVLRVSVCRRRMLGRSVVLQGKPPSDDNVFHMKRELGDIMWYWVTACAALDLDPFEVISENQKKLEARYGEQFEIERSEVRKEGDL